MVSLRDPTAVRRDPRGSLMDLSANSTPVTSLVRVPLALFPVLVPSVQFVISSSFQFSGRFPAFLWFSAAELATFVQTKGHCLMTHVDLPMFTGKVHYMFHECKRYFDGETPGTSIPRASDTVSLDLLRVSDGGDNEPGAATVTTGPVDVQDLNKWLAKCDVASDPDDLPDITDGERAILAGHISEVTDLLRRCLESGAHGKWSPEVQAMFDAGIDVVFPEMTLCEYSAAFREWGPILESHYYLGVTPSPEEEEGPYRVFPDHLLAAVH